MKLMWLDYLVYSLGNCAMNVCIETGLRASIIVGYKLAKCWGGEKKEERGEAGCKLTAILAQEPRNFVREISEPYINNE